MIQGWMAVMERRPIAIYPHVERRSGEGDAILMQLQSRPCNPSHHNVAVEDLNFMRGWKWEAAGKEEEEKRRELDLRTDNGGGSLSARDCTCTSCSTENRMSAHVHVHRLCSERTPLEAPALTSMFCTGTLQIQHACDP